MGVFDKIDEAEGFGGGVYFEPGVYVAQLVECKSGHDREETFNFFVADFDVLESTNPAIPVGTRVAWFAKLQKDTPALKNVRVFMATAAGVPEVEVTTAAAEMICGPGQPLKGAVLRVRAKTIITKKKGQPFTVCEFERYEGTAEMVRQLRIAAKLEAPREAAVA